MFVKMLIGRMANTIQEMPFHVATSNIANGTAMIATDEEVANAGLIPDVAPPITAETGIPAGFTVEATEEYGFDLFDAGGVRLNQEPFENLAAARSAANSHVEASVMLIPAAALTAAVESSEIPTRPERSFTLADYLVKRIEGTDTYDVIDLGGVTLNEAPLPSIDAGAEFAAEHLRLALDQGEDRDDGDAEVEVPAGWQDLHHAKRRALARVISGEEQANTEAADAVIRDYVVRRTA